ncbi:MAG: hypothetical protein V7K36_20115 [Nostoc sp.]
MKHQVAAAMPKRFEKKSLQKLMKFISSRRQAFLGKKETFWC